MRRPRQTNDPSPPEGEKPDKLLRWVKAIWACLIATLLVADLTLPRMVELEGLHDLIDRCLGNPPDKGPDRLTHGHLVPNLPAEVP